MPISCVALKAQAQFTAILIFHPMASLNYEQFAETKHPLCPLKLGLKAQMEENTLGFN